LLALLVIAEPLAAQRLIAVDSSRAVSEIDVLTGAKTPLGTIGSNAGTAAGLAYDQNAGKLYLTSSGNDSLYVVDVTNWSASLVGPYGNAALVMHGLEWDPYTSTLYGMSSHDGGLYTINTSTGAATLVGLSGVTSFCNLALELSTNVMWMTSSSSDSFYSIDRATGLATLVGPLSGSTNPNGLAFHSDNQLLYLVDNTTDQLYTIDTATGAATAIGATGSGNLLGLVYIPGNGRLTRTVHGCGATTIRVTGSPNIGFTVEPVVVGATGFPFVGFGVTPLGIPFCGCTVGHEWAVAVLGPTVPFTIPANPAFIGVQVLMQGMDFLGTGGCADPQLTLTDTITVTIG
jgi:DNA-binding beta-propeller fold protein YncE